MTTTTLKTLKAGAVLLDERNETLWVVDKKQTKDRVLVVSNRINKNEIHPVPYDVIKAHYTVLTNVAELATEVKTENKRQKRMTFEEMLALIVATEGIECKRMKSDTLAVKLGNKRLFRVAGRAADGYKLVTDRAMLFDGLDGVTTKVNSKGATVATLVTEDINAVLAHIMRYNF